MNEEISKEGLKIQQTIKTLKSMKTFYASYSDSERSNALSMAISRMEKEQGILPQKKIRDGNMQKYRTIYYCPKCMHTWSGSEKYDTNYCSFCGQKVRYED